MPNVQNQAFAEIQTSQLINYGSPLFFLITFFSYRYSVLAVVSTLASTIFLARFFRVSTLES